MTAVNLNFKSHWNENEEFFSQGNYKAQIFRNDILKPCLSKSTHHFEKNVFIPQLQYRHSK